MLLARLGTTKAKPNGLFIVPASAASSSHSSAPPLSPTLQFMATIPVRALPGVGRKLMKKLLSRSKGLLSGGRRGHAAVDEYQHEEDGDEENEDEDGGATGGVDGNEDTSKALTASTSSSSSLEFCSDLWPISLSTLGLWAGGPALAKSLYEACRGRDQRQLQPIAAIAAARKSVGAEVNYGHRYQSDQQGTAMEKAETFLLNLCEEVLKRLAQVKHVD